MVRFYLSSLEVIHQEHLVGIHFQIVCDAPISDPFPNKHIE